jgi:hypothetical protein
MAREGTWTHCASSVPSYLSASRRMRILSSVVYRLPFVLGPFSWSQTLQTARKSEVPSAA